jgi:hypothetical protein
MSTRFASLNEQLNRPSTPLAKGYMGFMIATIFGSIFFMFLMEEYPNYYTHDSAIVIAVESFLFIAFSTDFILRLISTRLTDWRGQLFLLGDGLAIVPSAMVVVMALGWDVHPENVLVFTLLRLFRLLRVLKLLRMGNLLIEILGVSVFTLVFGTVAVHLGIRVFVQLFEPLFGFDVHDFLDGPLLLMAVTAVGSAFGISMAITFGMVNRKREDITERHRAALDSVDAFERDIRDLFGDTVSEPMRKQMFDPWREEMDRYLNAESSYEKIKARTVQMFDEVRAVTKSRPSMDVVFHSVLVQRMSAFLVRAELTFPPAFYDWMKLLANLYFVLVMLAAPGVVGLVIQVVVIFVFYGLLAIIQDMDFAIDQYATIFNARIMKT